MKKKKDGKKMEMNGWMDGLHGVPCIGGGFGHGQ